MSGGHNLVVEHWWFKPGALDFVWFLVTASVLVFSNCDSKQHNLFKLYFPTQFSASFCGDPGVLGDTAVWLSFTHAPQARTVQSSLTS